MSVQAFTPTRAALIVSIALFATAGDPSAQQRDRYTLTGDQVAIHNLAGELRVEPGTGPAVVVEVVRGGRDAGALQVKTVTHRGIQTLVVIYPGSRVVYPAIPGRWNATETLSEDGAFDGGGFEWFGRKQITVSGSGRGTEARADLRVLVPKGKKLFLRHLAGRARIEGVEADLVVDHGVGDLEVRKVSGDVSLDTGSGEVSVTEVSGDLTVDSGSGAVTISGFHGGELFLDSGSGAVRASGVEARSITADTGSGEVDLEGVSADAIHLDTGSGGVTVDLTGSARDILVDSGSGEVVLRVPPGFGADFDIETSSGSIDVDVPHESFEIGRERVRGKIGDGRGTIRIDSGSGGVRIIPGEKRGGGRTGMLGTLLTHGVG